ncbi:MAG: ADP-ribosylation factor-like protein [Promethearchaeota archaeon]
MIYDYENKILQVKIVYYGPAMSGKTTSIKYLFSYFNKEDTLNSIDSTVGRTLLFDFGVLQFKGSEWSLKFLIYSATGQDFYASTRPATLIGVDAVIFVADSRVNCLHHNLRSWNELKTMFKNELYNLPMVISLNKSDFESKQEIKYHEFIMKININQFKYISANKTVATEGKGILDAFNRVITFIFPELTLKMSITN